jgi:hypothetical protein
LSLKQWQIKIVMALAGVIISLVLVELGLRILHIEYPVFYDYDPQIGYKLRPGTKGYYLSEGKGYVSINSDGLRDREHATAHPANTLRIAVLGDSYAEAMQVNQDEAFWSVMEKDLEKSDHLKGRQVEVIDFGQSGFGTTQELLTLENKVWKYSPDVVLLAFTSANDVADNSRALKKIDYLPYHVYVGDKLVLEDAKTRENWAARQHSLWHLCRLDELINIRIFQLVNHAKDVFQNWWARQDAENKAEAGVEGNKAHGAVKGQEAGISDSVYREPTSPTWQDAWRVTEGVLLQMRDEVEAKGAKFFVVTVTIGDQVEPDVPHRQRYAKWLGVKDLYYTEHRLEKFCREHHIPILVLGPVFEQYAAQHQVFLHGFGQSLGTGHWNQAGHRLAGQTIARWLGPQLQ